MLDATLMCMSFLLAHTVDAALTHMHEPCYAMARHSHLCAWSAGWRWSPARQPVIQDIQPPSHSFTLKSRFWLGSFGHMNPSRQIQAFSHSKKRLSGCRRVSSRYAHSVKNSSVSPSRDDIQKQQHQTLERSLFFFVKALRKGPSKERAHSWPPTPGHSKMMNNSWQPTPDRSKMVAEKSCWEWLLRRAAEKGCWEELLIMAAEKSCWEELLKFEKLLLFFEFSLFFRRVGFVDCGGRQPSRHFVLLGRPKLWWNANLSRRGSNLLVTSCSSDAQKCGEMQKFLIADATFSSFRARRTPKTVVKCEFAAGPRNPFVVACSSDDQNCDEMQIFPSTVQPRHFVLVGCSKLW